MLWIMLIFFTIILQFGFVLFVGFRNPSKTTAWLAIIFLFPNIGFVMYVFLAKDYQIRTFAAGENLKGSKLPEDVMNKLNITSFPDKFTKTPLRKQRRLLELLQTISESPITTCNDIQIYNNGKATLTAIIEELEKAKDHIHMEYYIIRSDKIGKRIQQILIRKAKEGVKVRLLYDGLGSLELSKSFIQELKDANVEINVYSPITNAFFNKKLNYRNHRKIVIVDGTTGFLGGYNIGDEYLGESKKFGFWRDTHLKIKGEAVFPLQNIFLNDWNQASKQEISQESYFPVQECSGTKQLQIAASGPNAHMNNILELYFGALNAANDRIYIATPYFIPDQSILVALKTAALCGVEVKIILPSLEDHILVKWAAFSYMEELMFAGIKFYYYNNGFIHSKVMIVDNILASVGTANLDMRSLFDNFELNAAILDEETIELLVKDFHHDLKYCKQIEMTEFCNRSKYQRAKEVLSRMLSPLL
ncbi:cardiolipin synthase [Bacillus sp. sid0103]|uniref:cardiolipin synthase n=1 Tax=Bacillus sp. sid0103 TaxID=2856337 RepID=UPI001C48BEB1|nr:cardiolipin synthase [Bacillus sp. sid0103]MBV7509661.1 cardiolipin synthase [Bacillus sp. sid0103]